MRALCENASKYGKLLPENQASFDILRHEMKDDQLVTLELSSHIKKLWSDPSFQEAYEYRHTFQLADCAKYFFERIDSLVTTSTVSYIPNEEDALRVRAPTSGIVECEFSIDTARFRCFDVGGQRNERKKWIHCFDGVPAVIFVVAISEYNQNLYEDETMNRLQEAMNLFDEICNSKWFRQVPIILFLNKRDLFADKLTRFPLVDSFPDYVGANTFEEASVWIQNQFEQKNDEQDKQIYTFITCGTDSENMLRVFGSIKDILIRKVFTRIGLL